jgi:hypothetical protein
MKSVKEGGEREAQSREKKTMGEERAGKKRRRRSKEAWTRE